MIFPMNRWVLLRGLLREPTTIMFCVVVLTSAIFGILEVLR